MKALSTKTLAGKLKTRTSRFPGSVGTALVFAFLLPLLTHSTPAAAAAANESTGNEPSITLANHMSGVAFDGRPMPPGSYTPANIPGLAVILQPAPPEEAHPYLRPATGPGRVVPQVEYLPGPAIKDIGSV
jgi:hypothetical protein